VDLFFTPISFYTPDMKHQLSGPLLLITSLTLGLAGCGKPAEKKTDTPPEKSTIQTAIDGFTGKTAVDAGLRAKEQIKKASETQMRDREEVMQ
jgi:hypothetical protein